MIAMSFPISGGDFDSAGGATRKLKEQLARIGIGATALRRAMIASYEAEMNVVIHARTGTLWARLDESRLDMEISDEGPGIPDVQLALREGWSTASAKAREMGFGAGMGLPNIRRNSDLFEIETRPGKGTRVRSTIYLRAESAASGQAGAADPAVASGRMPLAIAEGCCRSCLRCIYACPAAALRVRGGEPSVIEGLCIGCTACAAECPDGVFAIGPEGREPSAGQLPEVPAGSILLAHAGFLTGLARRFSHQCVQAALEELGFAEVRHVEEWEAALRAEARRMAGTEGCPRPLIPPFCPAVVALAESRFPSLLPNMAPTLSPIEAAGEEFPLRPLFLAAACPSEFAAASRSAVTGRLSVVTPASIAAAVGRRLAAAAASSRAPDTVEPGMSAGCTEPPRAGERAASGARRVLRVLAAAETGALADTTILELFLCEGGCAGSAFAFPDFFSQPCQEPPHPLSRAPVSAVRRSQPFAARQGVRLDPDMAEAIRKLSRIDSLAKSMPGRDCGACGAPSCGAFAEDVVMGRAGIEACPHFDGKAAGAAGGKETI